MRKTTKREIELGDDDLKDAVVTWLLAKGERLSGNVYVTVDSSRQGALLSLFQK